MTFPEDEPTKPRFQPVDLSELMLAGVLMAANERFFWPLGLALTWTWDPENEKASDLHVRQWVYPDGHHEAIDLDPDDELATERRTRFDAWALARLETFPIAEEQAKFVLAVGRLPWVERGPA